MDGITDSMDMNLNKPREMVKDREPWCAVCSPWGCKESDTTERPIFLTGFDGQVAKLGVPCGKKLGSSQLKSEVFHLRGFEELSLPIIM